MPVVRRQTSIPANSNVNIDLTPFDRFGLGGGAVRARAVALTGNFGDLQANLTIGSDQVVRDMPLAVNAQGVRIDQDPGVAGLGGPSDPVTFNVANTTAGAIVVDALIDVQNVA